MRAAKGAHLLRLAIVATLLALGGCGPASTPPKTDLTEEEQQQIEELNEQRADEWGTKR